MKFKQKGSSGFELIVTIVITVIFGIIISIGNVIWSSYQCSNYGDLTNRTTKYSIINGCFVKTDAGLIPQEEMSKRAYGNSITESTPVAKVE